MSLNSNSTEAWNKVIQTHDLFKKIIAQLKQHLGVNFGYMIAFNDGSYYQIVENLECLKKWVSNVETSHIFCARNVTTYFDDPYNFTIWPEEPTCTAMEIYKEYSMWNGITISKINKDYTELYWFTKQNAEEGWHKWFIRSKVLFIKFIQYFDKHKEGLLHLNNTNKSLFKYKQSFNFTLSQSEYLKERASSLNKLLRYLDIDLVPHNKLQIIEKLSPREMELLSIIGEGYTTKIAALKMNLAPKTAEHYIENIKKKISVRYKNELIHFYKSKID